MNLLVFYSSSSFSTSTKGYRKILLVPHQLLWPNTAEDPWDWSWLPESRTQVPVSSHIFLYGPGVCRETKIGLGATQGKAVYSPRESRSLPWLPSVAEPTAECSPHLQSLVVSASMARATLCIRIEALEKTKMIMSSGINDVQYLTHDYLYVSVRGHKKVNFVMGSVNTLHWRFKNL